MPGDRPNYVNQIRSMWSRLQWSQRRTIIGLGLLGVVFIGVLVYFGNKVEYVPLYLDLNPENAQAITSILQEQKKAFIVQGNSILVAAPPVEVDKLRLEIAAAGLARSGRIGYEYFDMNQFGMIDFTEQVNLRRAYEAELERTVIERISISRENARLSIRIQELYKEINRIQNEHDHFIKMNENLLKLLQENSRKLDELLNHHSYYLQIKQPF
jgi:flagellar M-ring protein FliF